MCAAARALGEGASSSHAPHLRTLLQLRRSHVHRVPVCRCSLGEGASSSHAPHLRTLLLLEFSRWVAGGTVVDTPVQSECMAAPAREFQLTLAAAQVDSATGALPALLDGTRAVRVTASTVRQLCRAVESELHCGCSVVLMHDGHVLSHASGGLDSLPSSCALEVTAGEKRWQHVRSTARPLAEHEHQPLHEQAFPPFLEIAPDTAVVVTAASGIDSRVGPKRRSIDFLLVGESVKSNRHLARFASAAYLPALLADPALEGLWRRKGNSLRKELIEAYVVVEALEKRVFQCPGVRDRDRERERDTETETETDREREGSTGRATARRNAHGVVIDLCSGKGFLSVIIGYEFPKAVVRLPSTCLKRTIDSTREQRASLSLSLSLSLFLSLSLSLYLSLSLSFLVCVCVC
eukprot:COSAG03_NODE_2729_length_2492_cov_8.770163_1_plen_406_part_10